MTGVQTCALPISSELLNAIRKVHTGGKYASTTLVERLAFDLGGDVNPSLHEALSDRELQVFRMISVGMKAKEIADELSISVRTVNTYRARILEKLNMKSNAELIRYALEHALIA